MVLLLHYLPDAARAFAIVQGTGTHFYAKVARRGLMTDESRRWPASLFRPEQQHISAKRHIFH